MRREFEAAVGRIITNQTAMQLFHRDSKVFLNDYDLTKEEQELINQIKAELIAMSGSFISKRKGFVQRPIRKSLTLMGEYGEKLVNRYLNLYLPDGNYTDDHDKLMAYIFQALNSSEDIENRELINQVLKLESALFKSLRVVVSGEELEHVNDPAPSFTAQIWPSTTLSIREGVFYDLFTYDLSNIANSEAKDLENISRIPDPGVGIIVYRKFGEAVNTLIKVSPGVVFALRKVNAKDTITQIAECLSREHGMEKVPMSVTINNLQKTFMSLSVQQVVRVVNVEDS